MLTKNAQHLLETRYLKDDEHTWSDLVARVARHAAPDNDERRLRYYNVIRNQDFLPSRMPYMGTQYPFSSSCFVLGPIEDSRESIFKVLSDMAEVQAWGGGCIGGESIVITNRGPMEMKQLVEKQDPNIKVLSYNPDTREMEFSEVSQWHTVKIDPGRVYRINFAHNSRHSISGSIRASDWHPFFVFDGEKIVEVRADELEPDMAIIGSTEYRRGYDAWGWLLGYIAGDGAIDYNRLPRYPRVRIVDDNEHCVRRAAETMGVAYKESQDDRYQVDMWEIETSADIANKIRDTFGGYKTAYTKCIPGEVWESSPERRFSFIVGHLDSDGSYNKEKKRFTATTVSEDLAQGLMALAGSLGIRTKLRERTPRRPNESTLWEITYLPSKKMLEDILSCSAKYNAANAAKWTKGTLSLSHSWRDRLEANGIKLGKPAWRGRITIQGKRHSLINWLQTGKATRGVAADIILACGEESLAQAVRSSQIVHSVERLSEGETLYDLTVPGNQTYVASPPGIGAFVVVHNTGYNFSRLRPAGDPISTNRGKASGPVSFMELYNSVTKYILRAGNKGGAQMGVLNVDHPDIEKFIWMKDGERDMTYFNVSVGITDDFMKAVEADTAWPLKFNGKVYREVGARELFSKIAMSAHNNGEPGVIFLDTVNKHNKFPEPVDASNPCWTGDTQVWTAYGPRTFKDLAEAGEDVPVLTQDDAGMLQVRMMRNPRLTRRNAALVKVTLDDGSELRCTPDHHIYLRDGRKVAAQDLQPGDSIASVYRHRANSKGYLRLTNGIESPLEHHVMVSWRAGRRPECPTEHVHHLNGDKADNRPDNLEIVPASKHNSAHMQGKKNPMYGVWDERNPLYGLDVSGKNNPRYRDDISTQEVKQLRKRGMTYQQIAARIGCSTYTVAKRLGWQRPVNHKVVGVESLHETEDVYNGTVDGTHRFFVMAEKGAILSANCGEQFLPPNCSCNLGSINLEHMVLPNGAIDYDKLRETVRAGVYFLNDSLDHAWWPLDEVREKTLAYRNIGLGVMGFANMLILMGVPYCSIAALRIADVLGKAISEYAGESARQYSLETGKRENTTLTTIAPTGSIATLANTSYSIEPLFGLAYVKNTAIGQMVEANPLFEMVAKREGFYSDELMEKIAATGSVQGLAEVPEDIQRLFHTATEIHWEHHVNMQATWQRHINQSVSKTVNLSESASVEDVKHAFMHAWRSGCKSTTVYRDNSRQVQVINAGTKSNVKRLDEVGLQILEDADYGFCVDCSV